MAAELQGPRPLKRDYRQTARAESVEATRRRIAEVFAECWREQWFDEITLEEVAQRADVSVRTVIRQFGGKEGLVGAFLTFVAPDVEARRTVTPGDVEASINRLFENYEADGDATIRTLAQEDRLPALAPLLARGREGHRRVVGSNFAPWLDPLPPHQRERTIDALVIATDIYVWKLLRRDMGHSETQAKRTMMDLVRAVLAQLPRKAPAPAHE